MLYDCNNPLDRENFLARANLLASRGEIVSLAAKRQRTLRQNSYLHVILEYFVCQYGESAEYVKREYFKILVNPDIFVIQKNDKFRGTVYDVRSSADLTTEEMTNAIERFRNWAAKEAGIYIPTAEEGTLISQMELEIARNKRFW